MPKGRISLSPVAAALAVVSEALRQREHRRAASHPVPARHDRRRAGGRQPPRRGAERPVDPAGRRRPAEDAIEEATETYRELAARWPDAYHHELDSRCEWLPGF